MPQSPTANMSLVRPSDHSDSDIWDGLLDSLFSLVDSHDHTTGKGVKIPSASLNVNADIPINSAGTHYALTDALAFDMFPTSTGSVAAYSSALFTNSADNNLYFRNAASQLVQITSGSTINVTVAGAIGGDYGPSGYLLDATTATDYYHFYQEFVTGVRQYAGVAHGQLDIFEQKAAPAAGVPANRVRQKSPAGLAASYDLTWLTALPAANTLMMVDNTGAITAPVASATLPNNMNLTLQGTGDYKHGNLKYDQGPLTQIATVGSISFGATADSIEGTISTTGGTVYFPLQNLLVGDRVQTVAIFGTAANEPTVTLIRDSGIHGATTPATSSAGTITGTNQKTLTVTTPFALVSGGENLWLKVVTGASTFIVAHIEITFDRP